MSSSGNSADEAGTPGSELTRFTSVTSVNSSKSVQFEDPTNKASSIANSAVVDDESSEPRPRETLKENTAISGEDFDPNMEDEAIIDDNEDPEMLRIEVQDDIMDDSSIRPSLAERKKKAPQRVLQIAQYIKLMEDRMVEMEKRLEELSEQKIAVPTNDPLYDTQLPPLRRVPNSIPVFFNTPRLVIPY